MIRPLSAATILALCLSLAPREGAAQRVLGPGPEAVTIPRGVLRTTIQVEHVIHRGRWNEGRAEDLGGGYSIGGLAAPYNSWLAALDAAASGLGTSGLNASLGAVDLDLRQRLAVSHLGLEIGLADWLTLSVDAPFVRARAEAQLRLRGDSGLVTAGINPIAVGSAVSAANRTVVDGYLAASTALVARRDACVNNAAAFPECPDILAELNDVNALSSLAATFGSRLATTYGANGLSTGLPFVPLSGSAAEQLLLARADSMRLAFERYGVASLSGATLLPLGAQAALSAEQLAALVADPRTGYGARPMTRTARQDLGDVDFGLRIRLFDSFSGDSLRRAANRRGIRQTVGLSYRLGGEFTGLSDNFIDLGTGSGTNAIGIRSFTDLVWNERFWGTVTLGWARAQAFDQQLRVPDFPGVQWLEAWRETTVHVTPGQVLDLRITPRWVLNDYLQLGVDWRWRQHGDDRYAIASPAVTDSTGTARLLSPAALDAQSGFDEQRFAWHLGYSTLQAFHRGVARLPFEVGYTHEQSVASSRGILPRRWEDRVQLRFYTRLFGR